MKNNNETKEKILEVTKELIRSNANVTVKDICDKAYVNISSINYHFGDKQNLMNIVLKDIMDEFKTYFITQLENNSDLNTEDTIALIIKILYQFSNDNKGMIKFMFYSDDLDNSRDNLGIIQNFLFKDTFYDTVMSRLIKITKDTDQNVIYAKYLILLSSLCLPMVLEIINSDINLTLNKDLMSKYVKLLEKILIG